MRFAVDERGVCVCKRFYTGYVECVKVSQVVYVQVWAGDGVVRVGFWWIVGV